MGIGDFVDSIGSAVENAVESATQKAGELADSGLDAAAGLAGKVGLGGVSEALDDFGDKIADLAGGEVKERELGETNDPKELIRGEPSAINSAAQTLQQMGDAIGKTGDALRQIDTADWSGQASRQFDAEFQKQPKLWWEGADAMQKASGILNSWFHEVTAAQTKASEAIVKWEAADTEERTKKDQWNALSAEEQNKNPLVDTWTTLRNQAREILRGARTQRDNAANTAASGLTAATESAPTEPPFTERWSDNFSDLSGAYDHAKINFTSGLLTSFTGIGQFVRQINPNDSYNLTHPAEYQASMSNLGAGLVTAVADPGATVSSMLSSARKNPSEFMGALTGDLITTVGTGGAGAAKPALSALDNISDLSKVSRVTNAAEHAPTPHSSSSPSPANTAPAAHQPSTPTGTHPNTDAPSPTPNNPSSTQPAADTPPAATNPTGAHPSTETPSSSPDAPNGSQSTNSDSPSQPGTNQPDSPTRTPEPDSSSPHQNQSEAPQQAHPNSDRPGETSQQPGTPAAWPDPDTPATRPDPDSPVARPDSDTPPRNDSPTPTPRSDSPANNGPQPVHDGNPANPDSKLGDDAPTTRHDDSPTTNPGGHDSPNPDSHSPNNSPDQNPTPTDQADADHGAGDTARENGADNNQTPDQTTCDRDPVDIASGEFLLPEVDVDLPGVLQLVLRRTHRSNYRYGRWFGPSWSATLDIRLVVEHQGVTFLGEDGIMLLYPHAAAGVPVEPVTGGQRWTLTRTEVGGYRLWDQERELIWHFAPEPGLGGLESQLGNYAISAITDRHRNRIRFHYNNDGTPVEVTHSGGYRVLVNTNAGRVTSLSVAGTTPTDTEIVTRVRDFVYQSGELTAVTNAVDATTHYTYDPEHRITSWTDSNGNQMVNTYDESGRVIHQRGTNGILNSDYDYLEFPDSTGSLTTVTDSLGAVTTHGFDRDRRLRDLVNPVGDRTHIDYNADRNPLKVVAPDGAVTQYQYTDDGDVSQITRPDGATISIDYLWRNRPISITEVDGSVRQQEWDKNGNLAAAIDPAGNRTEYTYAPIGAITNIATPTGARTAVEVNAAGLPIRITDPHGAVTRIERDLFGRPTTVTDPLGAQTRYEWSPDGKLLQRTDPDGCHESWTYDGERNVLTHTDRASHVTHFAYSAFDLLASRTEPDGSTTHYTWNTERRLTSVINPLGQTWSYQHDHAGRLITETDYTGATTHYTHDPVGRIATVTAATGVTRHHTHDILGRLTNITADTGEWLRYTHDTAGRVRTAISGTGEDPTHTLHFTYTPTGQLASQQLDDQPPMRFEHDQYGRRTHRTTPSGATTTWHHDFTGRVRGLTADDHDITFTHDPLGRLTGWGVGEISVNRTLASNGHVTSQEVTAFPGTTLNLGIGPADRPSPRQIRHDEYTYRPDGYLTTHTVTHPDKEPHRRDYTLDEIGRVTNITSNGTVTEQYSYDPLSNITESLTVSAPNPDVGGTGSAAHRVFTADSRREYRNNLLTRYGRTRYHYDASGRLIRKTVIRPSRKPDIWHYRYNAFDQLTDVWTPDQQWWHYTYDALNRRRIKQRLSTNRDVVEQTDYTWDGTNLLEEQNTDSNLRWHYQPDTHIAIIQVNERPAITRKLCAILADLVGTPAELVDATTATIYASAQASLWGHTVWRGNADTPLRFPGQIYDQETGLHHNLHRAYDPRTGRFLTQDPLGLAPAPNPNTYPHNPIMWSDPLGLIPDKCFPIYRTPKEDSWEFELQHGPNPESHLTGNQFVYFGERSVAAEYMGLGNYAHGMIRYDMDPSFLDGAFKNAPARYDWKGPGGAPRIEFEIPAHLIDEFNRLTRNRTWISMEDFLK